MAQITKVDASGNVKTYSLNSFLKELEDENRETTVLKKEKVHISLPYEIVQDKSDSSLKGDDRLVAAARCPNITCRNVDCRFMLKEPDVSNSSISIITSYASSGYDVKCECCDTEFRFNPYPSFMGLIKYDLLNNCYIPLSHVRDNLGVNIRKYC